MKLKVFKKFYYTTAFILVLTLTLVFVILSFSLNNALSKNTFAQLNKSCDVLSTIALRNESIEDFKTDVLDVSMAVEEINQLDVFVTDSTGKIIICSCNEYFNDGFCEHTDSAINKSILNKISENNLLEITTLNGRYSKPRYVTTKKIYLNSEILYIFSSSDVLTAGNFIKTLLGVYAVSTIIPLLFMFFAEYSLTYRIAKPLKYMSQAAQSIAKGDFSKRIPVMSNDEIGELSVLFNKMSDSLSRVELTSRNFVANISHELKTPMTTISGFIDGIVDGTIPEEKREYYLDIISSEIKRLSHLVQSMLSLSKLETNSSNLTKTKFDFSQMILDVAISMEKKIADKGIDMIGLDKMPRINIFGDEILLHSMVYNLIDNAVKYTNESGKISFLVNQIDESLEFRIRNSGKGIPSADLPNIFERFYKVDKSRSDNKDSLGLGLYICKTIANLHSGTISVDSVENDYTEFIINLPINTTEDNNGQQ